MGTSKIEATLSEILPFFDWSPFFWSWQLKGQFPAIFKRGESGKEAQKLYDDAQVLLERIMEQDLFKCEAAVGLWPAGSDGDDVHVFGNERRKKKIGTFHFLRRQQTLKNQPQFCLSDFIAPHDSGRKDYLGAFAVCAGEGVEELAREFDADDDDYNSIMTKALGDRFAEAMAEFTHKKVRDWWGFGEQEGLSNDELIKEKYRGIRPASGYPSQPDHTEKDQIWDLLSVKEKIGLELTESRAMNPGCSVSGLYFAHPEAQYFNVGSLGKDQVEDYAKRKGWSFEEAVKWLSPNIDFDV